MRRFGLGLSALLITTAVNGPAFAANTCEAEHLICGTTMPVGGYCECTAHGQTQSGTVVSKPAPRRTSNSTAGGCGAQPNAPGCR